MKNNLKYISLSLPTRFELFHDLKNYSSNHDKYAQTLIQISIDDYSDITDYFGVDIAREVVLQFADWIKNNLPTRSAKLYSFEMNKFVIYITTRTTVKDIDNYVKKIVQQISKKSFLVQNNIYNISLSIGVARGRKELFKRSYLALSHAKKKDKTHILFTYKEKIEEKFLKNIQIHQEIKEAIEDDRIVAVFQPIYNPKTNTIEKYEALMRIRNLDGSYKAPIEFLDVAKKVKLYNLLTKKMIKISLKNLSILQKPITINLSADDIENAAIAKFIYNTVNRANLGHLITFEIIETEEIMSFTKVSNFIKKMKSLGCKFAIDDFGSGFSNFEHILKLDIDYIKIDGSLIKSIEISKQNEIFVKNIVNLAKELGIETIAEYVYNKSIYDKVNSLGVDFMQGYYIGKPKSLYVA